MPIIRRGDRSQRHPDHAALVLQLTDHLHREADPGTTEEPRIYEEKIRGSKRVQLYVVWTQWGSVKEDERAAIILEAYENARGQQDMLNVSLAMGATPLEAKQLGIE